MPCSISAAARAYERVRSPWSMSTPRGPIISDTRPRAIMRIVAIWPSRKCACTRPSANAASPSLSASMKGICRSLQWIITRPSSGRPRVGNAARRSATSFCFGNGASSAQLDTTRAAAPMASPMEREERKAAMRSSRQRRALPYTPYAAHSERGGRNPLTQGCKEAPPAGARVPCGGSCRTSPSARQSAGPFSRAGRAGHASRAISIPPPAPCAGRASARRLRRRAR